MGDLERTIEETGVCGTQAGTEANVEDEDFDGVLQDFVGGVDKVWVSGYKSKGFTLSEIFRQKRLAKKKVSLTPLKFHHMSFYFFNIYR